MLNTLRCVLMISILYLYLQCVLAASYNNSKAYNIIGGHLAQRGEYPYQISLRNSWLKEEHICGGSIINKHYVVTAAQCFEGLRTRGKRGYYIGAGVINKSDKKHMVKKAIEYFICHKDYNPDTLTNDICLIKINGSFRFNDVVQPVQLNKEGIKEHTECSASGWGIWGEARKKYPNRLKGVTLPIANQRKCARTYRYFRTVYMKSMICAGSLRGGNNVCNGDIGGPLVCNGKLAGIISWGKGCAEANYPAVFVKIQQYIQWIERHITKSV